MRFARLEFWLFAFISERNNAKEIASIISGQLIVKILKNIFDLINFISISQPKRKEAVELNTSEIINPSIPPKIFEHSRNETIYPGCNFEEQQRGSAGILVTHACCWGYRKLSANLRCVCAAQHSLPTVILQRGHCISDKTNTPKYTLLPIRPSLKPSLFGYAVVSSTGHQSPLLMLLVSQRK